MRNVDDDHGYDDDGMITNVETFFQYFLIILYLLENFEVSLVLHAYYVEIFNHTIVCYIAKILNVGNSVCMLTL